MDNLRIAFIGLGLIGGSIAKTIKRIYPDSYICGFDPDQESLKLALSSNVVNESFPVEKILSSELLNTLDFLYLCAPVQTNIEYLKVIKNNIENSSVIVTDVGSVKGLVAKAAKDIGLTNFIGGHPMAGSEKTGFANANSYLIENVYYIIAGELNTKDNVDKFHDFIDSLGAIPIVLDSEYHDYIMAGISHMPHFIASALVNSVNGMAHGEELFKILAAGGFKDITRIASSSPVMWQQIAATNRENILKMIDAIIEEVNNIKNAIENDDKESVMSFMDKAREYRNSIPNSGLAGYKSEFKLHCDLADEEGGIATIATILANAHINIKNIGIVHNREHEEGALRIEFYDANSMNNSALLLVKNNYTVYLN